MTLAECLVLSVWVSIVTSSSLVAPVPWVSTVLDVDQGLYIHTFRQGIVPRANEVVLDETLLFYKPMPFENDYVYKWPRNGHTLDKVNCTEIIVTTDSHRVNVSSSKIGGRSIKHVIHSYPSLSKTRVTFRHFTPLMFTQKKSVHRKRTATH